MGAPVLNGPFMMPMFRPFVPRAIQPWIYILIAFAFQLSGGVYLGALNSLIGETSLMREDLTMCLYANLGGMAIWFPILFRMKFRFTNRTLLLASSIGVIICNLSAMYVDSLPLLWVLCFIEGICKIQGTFECMSNIQLWMTPKRDFSVFFPILHIVILGAIGFSDMLGASFAYYFNWRYMHWFIIGYQLLVCLIQVVLCRHFRMMRKFPLLGIDWLGLILWSVLLLEVVYFFNYGDWYDWFHSDVICRLSIVIVATLVICLVRMMTIRHPYLEPKMWTYKHLVPVLLIVMVCEMFLATENVLEEMFYEEGLHYSAKTSSVLNWFFIGGAWLGCIFSLIWMKVLQWRFFRLLCVGMLGVALYLVTMYFIISPQISINYLYLPLFFRGFGYAIISITLMNTLQNIMTFQHFFQSLCVFNMLHMLVGGVMGSAIYSKCISYFIADNISRYSGAINRVSFSASPLDMGTLMETFIKNMELMGIKQVYGVVSYACIGLLLVFLLYDMPLRHSIKKMPSWKYVRKSVVMSFSRFRGRKKTTILKSKK